MAADGMSHTQIGRELGLNKRQVEGICRQQGIVTHAKRYGRTTSEFILAIAYFSDQGMTYSQIGRELGRDTSRIRRKCLQYGIITNRAAERQQTARAFA
jgi:hypothetical protein